MHSTNCSDTLIKVAEDSPAGKAQVPPERGGKKTIAALQFEMIGKNPYRFTSDDVIFGVHALRNGLAKSGLKKEREKFFSKGQPCLRTSPLPKKYGWGIHSNKDGKVALIAVESEKYRELSEDQDTAKTKAMRSKRA